MKKVQNYKKHIRNKEDRRLGAATIDGAFVFGLYIYVIFVLSNREWFKAFLVKYNQMGLVLIRGILAIVVFLFMEVVGFLDVGKVFMNIKDDYSGNLPKVICSFGHVLGRTVMFLIWPIALIYYYKKEKMIYDGLLKHSIISLNTADHDKSVSIRPRVMASVLDTVIIGCIAYGVLSMLRFWGGSTVFNMIFGSSASLLMCIFAFYTAAFFIIERIMTFDIGKRVFGVKTDTSYGFWLSLLKAFYKGLMVMHFPLTIFMLVKLQRIPYDEYLQGVALHGRIVSNGNKD